jgi:mannan polymerase II complex MNN10 subunit
MEFDWFGDGFWHKLNMIERLIQHNQYDWIWWIDFDTIITNTTVKLEDLIQESLVNVTDPNNIDMILTPDWYIYPPSHPPTTH